MRTRAEEVKTTELATFGPPTMISTLAKAGLVLAESKTPLVRLQAGILCVLHLLAFALTLLRARCHRKACSAVAIQGP